MVVLVSDLHLAESPTTGSVDVPTFIRRIKRIVNQSKELGIKTIYLVLLGDIFEMLKSRQWLDSSQLRPWQTASSEHIQVVDSIFSAIEKGNEAFFEGLHELASPPTNVRLVYVPGNHDRSLNTDMGIYARSRLQSLVPLEQKHAEEFKYQFVNSRHSLIAKHGHEWDPLNSYGSHGNAIGDAIVIDILLKLPVLVSDKLGIAPDDPDLWFLHQLDNVRPQTPNLIEGWIQFGIAGISQKHPRAFKAFQDSCDELVGAFQILRKNTTFQFFEAATWWLRMLTGSALVVIDTLGALQTARYIPWRGQGVDSFRDFAISDLQANHQSDTTYRYVVCGHTHNPAIVPLNVGVGERAKLYINTGAWRRIHKIAHGGGSPNPFASYDEACVVAIYDEDEQKAFGQPPYEFQRLTQGA